MILAAKRRLDIVFATDPRLGIVPAAYAGFDTRFDVILATNPRFYVLLATNRWFNIILAAYGRLNVVLTSVAPSRRQSSNRLRVFLRTSPARIRTSCLGIL